MAQLLPPPGVDTRADGEFASLHPELASWWSLATTAESAISRARILPSLPRTPASYVCVPQNDLLSDVMVAQDLVRGQGMELLVLDQTRPDVRLPVVKVIVPGMRHFWARFAPGRLYEVPVTLGRKPHEQVPVDLNPIPLFV